MSFVIGELTARIDANSDPFNRRIDQTRNTGNNFITGFSRNLSSIGSGFEKIGGSLIKSVSLPIAAAGIAVTKLGADFETEMSKIVGLVGVSETQVKQWGNEILKLSPEIGKPPKELAEALFFVTSAGIKGAEAMEVLAMSAKASSVGLGETKVVADLVTSAMNAYGKENLSATKATDILVAAVREGKTEANALASAMGGVLPIASAMEVEFDEVSAAIAAMTRTGTDANTASVQLKAILSSLLKPSKEASDTLQMMGTSAEELRKKIREDGLLATLMELDELTKKYGEDTVAKVFPNIRALSGFLDLMGNNVEDNVKIFGSLKNSTGMLDEAFKTTSETLDFKFNQSLSTLKVTAIEFFDVMKESLLPILNIFNDVMKKVNSNIEKMTKPQKSMLVGLLAIAAAMPFVILAFGKLISIIGATIEFVSLVTGTIAAIGAPTLIAVGVIATLAGGFIALMLSSEKVRKAIKDNFDKIINKIKDAAEFIINHFDDIKKAFEEFVDALNNGDFTKFTATMLELIPEDTKDDFIELLTNFIIFRDKLIELRDNIIEFAGSVVKALTPAFNSVKEILGDMDWESLKKAWEDFYKAIEPILPLLKDVLKILINLSIVIVGNFLGSLTAIISIVPNFIASIFNILTALRGLFDIFMGLITIDGKRIKKGWSELWNGLSQLVSNYLKIIEGYFGNLGKFLFNFFTGINTNIGDKLCPDFVKKIKTAFSQIPTAARYVNQLGTNCLLYLSNLKVSFLGSLNGLVLKIVNTFSDLPGKISGKMKSFFSSGKTLANSLYDGITAINFYKVGTNIIKSVINGIKDMFSDLKNTCWNVGSIISSYFPHSPAREGPLKNLDKLNFKGPILESLNKVKDSLSNDWLGKILINNPDFNNIKLSANDNNLSGTTIKGNFNFYGVNDVKSFMQEMESVLKRYGGKL